MIYKDFNKKNIIKNIELLKRNISELEKLDSSHPEVEISIQLMFQAITILTDFLYEDEPPIRTIDPETIKINSEIFKKFLASDIDTINSKKIYIPIMQNFIIKGYNSFLATPYFEEYTTSTKPKDTNYKHDEIMEIIHDFYMSIPDKEIRDAFLYCFDYRRKNFRIKGSSSETFYLPIINEPYITVSNEVSNSKKVINGMHEYGHAVSQYLDNKFLAYEDSYPFLELMSMTLESIGAEYMKKYDPNCRDIVTSEQLDYLYTLLDFCKTLIIQNNIAEKNYKYLKCAENYCIKTFGIEERNKIITYPALQTFTYSLPFTIVTEIFDIYKYDPEYAMYILKRLDQSYGEDYIKLLDELEIEPSKHLDEYVKTITKKKSPKN